MGWYELESTSLYHNGFQSDMLATPRSKCLHDAMPWYASSPKLVLTWVDLEFLEDGFCQHGGQLVVGHVDKQDVLLTRQAGGAITVHLSNASKLL